MKILFACLCIAAITASCGQEGSTSADEKSIGESSETSAGSPSSSPCEFISESDVNAILNIPAGTKSSIDDTERTYPTCFYKWETLTFPKTSTFGGTEVSIDYPYEMTVVFVDNATPAMFQQSTKVYRDGVDVEGVGEMAIWGDLISQLTFLAKGRMVHVHVKTTPDAAVNKSNAIKIAKKMAANF